MGENREGYWNNDKLMAQVKNAADIVDLRYPKDHFDVMWLFDNAPSHRKFADESLSTTQINVRDGGKQPVLRDTSYTDGNGVRKQQIMYSIVNGKKVPKGMKSVLTERGINTTGMKAADMAAALAAQPDFSSETCILVKYLSNRGYQVKFCPKFHAEFKPIERYWGQAKRSTRSTCKYTIVSLRKSLKPALDNIPVSTLRKFFRKMRDYLRAYQEGNQGGQQVELAVTRYKSHRRPNCPVDQPIAMV